MRSRPIAIVSPSISTIQRPLAALAIAGNGEPLLTPWIPYVQHAGAHGFHSPASVREQVMFVCPDPLPLLDVIVKLVEAIDTDNDFPRLRAGVASGMAVSRAGDWFGSPVNVASRVTNVARPGTVLVAD